MAMASVSSSVIGAFKFHPSLISGEHAMDSCSAEESPSVRDLEENDSMVAGEGGSEKGEEEEEGTRNSRMCPPNCQQCGQNPCKYKCPRCGLQSCGLACVKAHKEVSGCTGIRDRTAFVPLSLYDDNRLISDYNFLEETLRQADSAKRMRSSFPVGLHDSRWKTLMIQARNRKITLVFVTQGMTRRQANTSFYWRKCKCIFWRIEWVFHSTDVRLVDRRVNENAKPIDVLEERLAVSPGNATTCHQLKRFCKDPIGCLRFLLVKEPCSGTEKQFVELNPSEPLGSQLENNIIIEFPTIHVVLPTDVCNLIIVEDLRFLDKQKQLEVSAVDCEVEVPYREEEIEEGEIEELEEGEIVQ